MFSFSWIVLVLSACSVLLLRPLWLNLDILLGGCSGESQSGTNGGPNVLLLTAHPDDECMFFAPTLLALRAHAETAQPAANVFSLCLSVGNADGLGGTRRLELERSLDVLGIEPNRRWVEDRPDLQDNITARWDPEIISEVLRPYVLENEITTILTFDQYGISGHPNHISLPLGAARLIEFLSSDNGSNTPLPRLFTLVSATLLQKYTGPIAPLVLRTRAQKLFAWGSGRAQRGAAAPDAITAHSTSTPRDPVGQQSARVNLDARCVPIAVSGAGEYQTALRAMMQHRSQLVWFRWLYVAFSWYMWVNEWVEVHVGRGDTVAGVGAGAD
ncbi:LmbE-like protein [Wolfiporia cocos MD-104 SS10]|uniref:N-acetylglucosaminylphosphatidylinositol deacetylase n=1 Tax=Wolfiporia cocos (strain MD-104) TaxID=742152 RepID=A0A2H3IYW9_WOLCO|nr:LmbE-like protein [Wolfiporia cocos MD-104 SS10]